MMFKKTIKKVSLFFVVTLTIFISGCNSPAKTPTKKSAVENSGLKNISYVNNSFKSIHVFVALCDNKYQGIVPVPAKIGNGQDPDNNLYWGGAFGCRSYFKKSKEWKLVKIEKVNKFVLERLVFKSLTKKYYLVADAYDGRYIKQATKDFLYSNAGKLKDTLHINKMVIGVNGNSSLVAYIGHDGLMDFQLADDFKNADDNKRDCMILACISKKYFAPFIKSSNSYPIVWTSGLMCPEAYTLHDAITGYINKEPYRDIKSRAVNAYNKYQKCGTQFANTLLISGW